MRMTAGDNVKEIINKDFDSRVAMMVVNYIIDNGWENVRQITEEEIEKIEGNSFMTAEFLQALVRTSARICKETNQIDDFLPFIVNYLYVPNASTRSLDFYKEESTDETWETIVDAFDIDEDEYDEGISVITVNANVVEIS